MFITLYFPSASQELIDWHNEHFPDARAGLEAGGDDRDRGATSTSATSCRRSARRRLICHAQQDGNAPVDGRPGRSPTRSRARASSSSTAPITSCSATSRPGSVFVRELRAFLQIVLTRRFQPAAMAVLMLFPPNRAERGRRAMPFLDDDIVDLRRDDGKTWQYYWGDPLERVPAKDTADGTAGPDRSAGPAASTKGFIKKETASSGATPVTAILDDRRPAGRRDDLRDAPAAR